MRATGQACDAEAHQRVETDRKGRGGDEEPRYSTMVSNESTFSKGFHSPVRPCGSFAVTV